MAASRSNPFATYTLRIHYGGSFSGSLENLQYRGGMVKEIEADPDFLCYYDFAEFAKGEGFHNMAKTYWLFPGKNLGTGLKLIWDDASVLEMGGFLEKFQCLDIYMEHSVDEPEILSAGALCGPSSTDDANVMEREEARMKETSEDEFLKNVAVANEDEVAGHSGFEEVSVSVGGTDSDEGSRMMARRYNASFMRHST